MLSIVLLWVAHSAASVSATPSFPVELLGVWRAPGYGMVLDVRAEGITAYGENAAGCLVDKAVTQELAGESAGAFAQVEVLGPARVRASASATATRYTLERLEAVPEACAQGMSREPQAAFEYLVAVMDAHYPFFTARGVDWPTRVAGAREALGPRPSAKRLRRVLGELLRGFDDSHLSLSGKTGWVGGFELPPPDSRTLVPLIRATLEDPQDDRALRKALNRWYGQQITQTNAVLFAGAGTRRSGLPLMWGKLGNVGVVVQIGMQGFTDGGTEAQEVAAAHAIFDEIIDDFAAVDAVVFDVSLNFGGFGEVAQAVASRFATQERFAYSRFVPAEGDDSRQRVMIIPSQRSRFTGPVYLLTSDQTVSAGEEFAMLMRVQDNVVHYGEPTHGSLSDLLPKTLPNGWVLTLSNQIYTMADGVCYEGRGVPPEQPMTLFRAGNLKTARFDAVKALAAIAREQVREVRQARSAIGAVGEW